MAQKATTRTDKSSNLKTYFAKRDFKKTKEPKGRVHGKGESRFVIHRHEASHLHFDFRLELGGTLKSWAVPKEPTMDPSVKRLAVQVEDHPVEYATFHGDIPEGEYGAGHVDIWDEGHWKPLDKDPLAAYEKGKLTFELFGQNLRGQWVLLRSGSLKGRSKQVSWLLIKKRDEFAVEVGGEGEAAKSARRSAIKTAKKSRAKRASKTSALGFVEPELATLVDQPPKGSEWIFETKFDGYRILASVKKGSAKLFTRRGNDWSTRFPSIQTAVEGLDVSSALIDGELVALNKEGSSSFQVLQNSLTEKKKSEKLVYYAFDLLEIDGEDLRSLPLLERKKRLAELIKSAGSDALRFSEHSQNDGDRAFKNACREGLEGIVCKRADSIYREGRGEDWLKVKCMQRQEFVVVGYTDPQGAREKLGALLLATRETEGEKKLHFVGKVGTGFGRKTLDELFQHLTSIETKNSPLKEPAKGKGIHWVKPQLVAEVSFSSWTDDGILRHPSFEGLREDKQAGEVIIEKLKKTRSVVEQKKTALTHPDRVLFAESGFTKQELAEYYQAAYKWMAPFIDERPLGLVRCPGGASEQCFIQKHFKTGMGEGLAPAVVPEKGKRASHIQIVSPAGLTSLVQNGALEIHTWGAKTESVDHPDQLVFDFDPDPTTPWPEVVTDIKTFRKVIEAMGFNAFLKLSGNKGAHVHVPIVPESSWDEAHDFAQKIAQELEAKYPKRYTASSLKSDRKGKVYVDYVRNSQGVTFVAPYSTRAKPAGPVALPIDWDELSAKVKPNRFTVRDVLKRIAKMKVDPWADFFSSAKPVTEALNKPASKKRSRRK